LVSAVVRDPARYQAQKHRVAELKRACPAIASSAESLLAAEVPEALL
jgi:hypothetical protein